MEGERERKRKRGEKGRVEGGDRLRKEMAPLPAPTEEEVEEFFSILRRMKVAVRHFEKSGHSKGDGRKLTEILETEVSDGVIGVNSEENRTEIGDLDLNVVPEA